MTEQWEAKEVQERIEALEARGAEINTGWLGPLADRLVALEAQVKKLEHAVNGPGALEDRVRGIEGRPRPKKKGMR